MYQYAQKNSGYDTDTSNYIIPGTKLYEKLILVLSPTTTTKKSRINKNPILRIS